MKKKFAILLILINTFNVIYGYDFKEIVFGNNYNKIKQVDPYSEKGQSILKEIYSQVVSVDKVFDGENWNREILSKYDSEIDVPYFWFYLFEETYTNGTIWRVLTQLDDMKDDSFPTFDDLDMYAFIQIVFFKSKDKLICLGCSPIFHIFDDGERSSLDSNEYIGIDVIHRENKIIGVLQHKTSQKRAYYSERSEDYELRNKSAAWYISYEKLLETQNNTNLPDNNFIKNNYDFNIVASFALIDSQRPFMYTINNAFDGNTSTSFVEDTDDDKLFISFNLKNAIQCSKMKIINGFGKNEQYYLYNNRVKSISNIKDGKNITLNDNTREFQIIDYYSFNLFVNELYKGSKYSDTCIAELDFMTTKNKWLFE